MIESFIDLIEVAKRRGEKGIAVAAAEDKQVLEAIKAAIGFGIIHPILIGDRSKITEISQRIKLDLSNIEIIDEKDKILAARKATELVSSGQADILMKGLVDTSIIMKQVLDKEIGLRTEKVISHAAVFDVKTYHKVFIVTDAAMNIGPNIDQKKEIIENSVALAHSLGIKTPKVAIIAAKEKVSPKMEATIHAKELEEMNKGGQIKGCIVEGPLSLDIAISKGAAEHKGVDSIVAGDADILLVPNIEAGNVLYKSLTFLAGSKSAGIILGARAPIVLTSRADSEEAKLYSIVLGTLLK